MFNKFLIIYYFAQIKYDIVINKGIKNGTKYWRETMGYGRQLT